MALNNVLITLVGLGAIAYLMKADVRTGAGTFRRNLKHIKGWLEEASPSASQASSEAKQIAERETKSKPPDKV